MLSPRPVSRRVRLSIICVSEIEQRRAIGERRHADDLDNQAQERAATGQRIAARRQQHRRPRVRGHSSARRRLCPCERSSSTALPPPTLTGGPLATTLRMVLPPVCRLHGGICQHEFFQRCLVRDRLAR